MDEFFSSLPGVPLAALRDGWLLLILGGISLFRAVLKGQIITKGQFDAMIDKIEEKWAKEAEHAEEVLELQKSGCEKAYAALHDTYEARLKDAQDVAEDARTNLRGALRLMAEQGIQIKALARSAGATEHLLLALEEALGVSDDSGAGADGAASREAPGE